MIKWENMNNKLLTGILIIGIASTGFAGISSANEAWTVSWTENYTNLSEILDNSKNFFKGKHKIWKRKGMSFLSEEEKMSLESMSDEEKEAFFTVKKEERKAEKEAHRAIINKLLNWEVISEGEKTILEASEAKKAEMWRNNLVSSPEKSLIKKLIAWEELSADEQILREEIKEKRKSRAEMKELSEKKKAWEELTDTEQEQLDNFKAEFRKEKGKRWWKWGKRWENSKQER